MNAARTDAGVTRLQLPDVTLACVDTRAPEVAAAAMQQCMAQIDFGRVILFTDRRAIASLPAGIDGIAIELASVPEYSEFMLRGIGDHITTDHLLIVQWDGYVLDAARWQPAFLECDYIGALFHVAGGGQVVGNGGFSLRSRRLLNAMQDPAMVISNPEDACICVANRQRLERDHGIRFAAPELAARFSFERIPSGAPTFGFHGLFNMHRVLSYEALTALVTTLPDALTCGVDGRDLCRALIDERRFDLAATLIAKRRRLGALDRRTLRLRWALALARLRHTPA